MPVGIIADAIKGSRGIVKKLTDLGTSPVTFQHGLKKKPAFVFAVQVGTSATAATFCWDEDNSTATTCKVRASATSTWRVLVIP